MSVIFLIQGLRKRGVRFERRGANLHISAPVDVLDDQDREEIRQFKDVLLAHVDGPPIRLPVPAPETSGDGHFSTSAGRPVDPNRCPRCLSASHPDGQPLFIDDGCRICLHVGRNEIRP